MPWIDVIQASSVPFLLRCRPGRCDIGRGHRAYPGTARLHPLPGFTLVELLVVIAIIAMFMAALFPAVQSMRGTARRAQCQNQLLQLLMAAQNYEMTHESFPAGVTDPAPGPIRSIAEGQHYGWIIELLPYLDESNVHRRIDFNAGVYAPANEMVRGHVMAKLICPADVTDYTEARSSYAACHHGQEAAIDSDNNGVFFLNSHVMIDDIRDGLSQTIFLGEKLSMAGDLGWMSGTLATLRNTGSPLNRDRSQARFSTRVDEAVYQPATRTSDTLAGAERSVSATPGVGEEVRQVTVPRQAGTGTADVPGEVNDGENAANSTPIVENATDARFVGGFGSWHESGAHMAFGDGRIQFMTQQIDPRILQLLGNRDDGTLLRAEDYRE